MRNETSYKRVMAIQFHKMHGLSNDFVIIDRRGQPFSPSLSLISALCDRRTGVGCDQLVLLDLPTVQGADVGVRFFNPDGSEAGACGNASRCVSLFLGGEAVLQTRAGLLPCDRTEEGLIRVDMGRPSFAWQDIPLAAAHDTLSLPLEGNPAACAMGNPHVTYFEGLARAETRGKSMERHPIFPERANIGSVELLSREHIRLRVWERGAGMTMACGSGACAAVVNGVRRKLLAPRCRVTMDGGTLIIEWREQDGHVLMTGLATYVFEGCWPQ